MKRNTRKIAKHFLLGQDTEFVMLHKGKTAPLCGNIQDSCGYDGINAVNRVAEVRGVPSECPIEIVHRIREAFQTKIKSYPQVLNYTWQAGSYKLFPIGFHQHFGVTEKDIKHELANKIIGNYSGAISLLCEDRDEGFKRRNDEHGEQYGWLSNWRPQPYGGFEARVFSSALVSPAIMLAHLCLNKVIMFELLNNQAFNPHERFDDSDFQNMRTDKIKKHFHEIWSEISQMTLFKQYKEYLNIFPFLIERNLSWYNCNSSGEIEDLKVTWGLSGDFKPEIKQNKENVILMPKKHAPIVDAIPAPLPQHKENFKNFIWAKVPVEGIFA